MNLKKPKAVTQTVTSSAGSMPLKAFDSNVNVLKVEKFNGNVSALRNPAKNAPIPVRSAIMTPGGHVRRNDFNKENDDQNFSSDTLSMTDLLSSSKVQGNSTKTSLDDDCMTVPATNDLINESIGTSKSAFQPNDETTPTTSPVRNRKRSRSNDRSTSELCTPPSTAAALDVHYNRHHRLSVQPRTPPKNENVDVLFSTKHRLTPSPRNVCTPETLEKSNHRFTPSAPNTPETPRSKANLNVLFNHTHRLTPSPVQQQYNSSESGNSTPVPSSQHSTGLHLTHSINYLGPSHSNMRNFDANLRSPKLLTQSNSQFSSVSDLREFAVKSSQSVISWPSQKLRTASMKQFTIKNIGGKKLTMRIEVVGPGFQVSDGAPKIL